MSFVKFLRENVDHTICVLKNYLTRSEIPHDFRVFLVLSGSNSCIVIDSHIAPFEIFYKSLLWN